MPLTNRKHVTLEKTKSYKRLIYFSIGSLRPISAALFKLDLATFAIRGMTVFGMDGGWTTLWALHWERRHLFQLGWPRSLPPHSSSRLRSPVLILGFGVNYTFFGSFSAHLMSATCSPMEQSSATGAQRSRGSTDKGWQVVGAAQVLPVSRTNLS